MWQHHKASGICKHNVFVRLVDHWVLLGWCWWARPGPGFTSDLLVRYLWSNSLQIFPLFDFCTHSLESPFECFLWLHLQAMYYISHSWCGLCGCLCCCCLPHRHCSVLLSPLHNCSLVCSDWSGSMNNLHLFISLNVWYLIPINNVSFSEVWSLSCLLDCTLQS